MKPPYNGSTAITPSAYCVAIHGNDARAIVSGTWSPSRSFQWVTDFVLKANVALSESLDLEPILRSPKENSFIFFSIKCPQLKMYWKLSEKNFLRVLNTGM